MTLLRNIDCAHLFFYAREHRAIFFQGLFWKLELASIKHAFSRISLVNSTTLMIDV